MSNHDLSPPDREVPWWRRVIFWCVVVLMPTAILGYYLEGQSSPVRVASELAGYAVALLICHPQTTIVNLPLMRAMDRVATRLERWIERRKGV